MTETAVYSGNGNKHAIATSSEVEAALGRPWPAGVAMPANLSLDGLLGHLECEFDIEFEAEIIELIHNAAKAQEPVSASPLAREACWGEVVYCLKQYGVSDEVLYQLRWATCRAALGALDRAVADHKSNLAYTLSRRFERGDWLR